MADRSSSSSSQRDKKQRPPQSEQAAFTFVSDGSEQHAVRSHAMREHWKQRRQRRVMEKKRYEDAMSRSQPILPMASNPADVADPQPVDAGAGSGYTSGTSTGPAGSDSYPGHGPSTTRHEKMATYAVEGIPAQALAGMNLALGSSKLDPFDRFPVKLTPRHHQLLHHWLVTYSAMFFDRLSATAFNPMRDIWLPLDLSNAASFNGLMAHSAAHLTRMYGYRHSEAALEFKAEAVRIVATWMGDPELCMSDEMIAAVLRLLTFERYWGTEAEWRIHHRGLLHLIRARGGVQALRSNWRIGLPSYLVSLMGRPSWFDTSNQIWEISDQPDQEWARDHMHQIRCLWLLSFVQDIGTFVCNDPYVHTDGLSQYPAVREALGDLQTAARRSHAEIQQTASSACDDDEFKRLASLLLVCVLAQASLSVSQADPVQDHPDGLSALDAWLGDSRQAWKGSVLEIYKALVDNFFSTGDRSRQMEYALKMTSVLASLSCEARRGVENCLLHMMLQTGRTRYEGILADGRDYNLDSLLASIHGD